jgi:hypothetical protein
MSWVLLNRPAVKWRGYNKRSTKTPNDVARYLINSKSLDKILFFTAYGSQFAMAFRIDIPDDLTESSLYILIHCKSVKNNTISIKFTELKNDYVNKIFEGCNLLLASEVHDS